MEIIDYSENSQKERLLVDISSLMKSKRLIPVIGSGFTGGTETKRGRVPFAEELKSFLIDLAGDIQKLSDDEKSNLYKESLMVVSEHFWAAYEEAEQKHIQTFMQYLENNFLHVISLDQYQRKFLNSGWRYIYTLNYDDAIENTLINIEKIVPYDRQNRAHLDERICLYKIHGDISRFLNTGERKYLILSRPQYINALKDKSNADMLNRLQTDFYSNSILFVGCGLQEELDLLFTADINLAEKITIDRDHKVYYLYYNKNLLPTERIPILDQVKLRNYGITNVIRVNTLEDIKDFCYSVNAKYKDIQKIRTEDELNQYTDIQFSVLDDRNRNNIEYLFFNNRVSIDSFTKTITLPSFFIRRSLTNSVIRDIKKGLYVVNIICGNRFSGKTYCLLDIVKELYSNTYYFPSIEIDNQLLLKILDRNNSIFIFDEGSINDTQVQEVIFENLEKIKTKNNQVIISVNRSNGDLMKYYIKNRNHLDLYVKFYQLGHHLNEHEINLFNKKVAMISLIDFEIKDSILDYLMRAEKAVLKKEYTIKLPRINFLTNENPSEIKAMIMLANEGVITSSQSVNFGVDKSLYELCDKAGLTIQRDYLSDIELTSNVHSGFKFVANSIYWIFRCLSKFADDKENFSCIAQAYYDIISDYKSIYTRTDGTLDYTFYKKILPYYFLENMQLVFSNEKFKGTIELPNIIYDKLHSFLSDDYQFLHQEAKCKLRVARRKGNLNEKTNYLDYAYRHITRAYELAEKSNAKNVQYTLGHMLVTKALILTNYIIDSNDAEKVGKIQFALETYYQVLIENENLLEELDRDENEDYQRFLLFIRDKKELNSSDKKIAEKILSISTKKKIRLK